jgi:tetratricopeptide (TPR) repeat protein
VPLKWATTQNNLGNALFRLGERESGTGRLEEAVAAYRQALTEWTRDRAPLDWATTQNNLGNALFKLGERESGTERLKEAVAAYRAGLEVFERAQATHYVETTKGNLFRAEALLRKRQNLQNQILAKWGSRVYALAVRQVV